ncbi:MAG: TerB family tellurite resistance protein [Gemmatimonadota bacterium]
MLIDSIRSLFGSRPPAPAQAPLPSEPEAQPPSGPDPLHLAACALLLDVAHADGEFSDAERAHLEEVLERHFSLPPEAGHTLLELAEEERENSIDHIRFTNQLQHGYDTGQKMVLAEIMWGVVLADGEIAEHEQYLTRKISNLLGLEPGYLSAAKAAAARHRG